MIGQILAMIEAVVTIMGSVILTAGPYRLRWNHRVAKILCSIMIGCVMIIGIVNTFFAKFSSIEYTIREIMLLFIVVLKRRYCKAYERRRTSYWQSQL